MTAEGVLLLFGIFVVLIIAWALAQTCSLNEQGSPPPPVERLRCCPECKGEGAVNVTIGSVGPECDLCRTCGGTGTVVLTLAR